MIKLIYFTTLCIFITSCNNDGNITYKYAIKDFSKELQPLLTNIVTKGIVEGREPCLREIATDKELIKLTKSEHPVLRASAYREILQRKTFDHYKLLLENLSDTAMVQTDAGEFGFWYRKVSDDLLIEANWGKLDTSNKIEALLITKHNYLKAAYTSLNGVDGDAKYYPYIKKLATRNRKIYNGADADYNFEEIELAIFALAKYRKQEDIILIKNKLLNNITQISTLALTLINIYTDTSYNEVLQKYYDICFYKLPNEYRGFIFKNNYQEKIQHYDFIVTLVKQKNYNSARLPEDMLVKIPLKRGIYDKKNICVFIINCIKENSCPAYKKLSLKYERITSTLPL